MFDIFNSTPDPITDTIGSLGMARLVFRGSSENAWKREYRTKTTFKTTLVDDYGFVIPSANRDPDNTIRPIEQGRTYKTGIRCYKHDNAPFSLLWDKAFIVYATVGDEYYVTLPQLVRQAYDLDEGSPIEVAISAQTSDDDTDDTTHVTERDATKIRTDAPFDVDDSAARIAPSRPRVQRQPPKPQTSNDADTQDDIADDLPNRDDLHIIIAAWLSDTDPNLDEYAHVIQGYPSTEEILLTVDSVSDISSVNGLTDDDASAVRDLLDGERSHAEIVATLEQNREESQSR